MQIIQKQKPGQVYLNPRLIKAGVAVALILALFVATVHHEIELAKSNDRSAVAGDNK